MKYIVTVFLLLISANATFAEDYKVKSMKVNIETIKMDGYGPSTDKALQAAMFAIHGIAKGHNSCVIINPDKTECKESGEKKEERKALCTVYSRLVECLKD